MICLTYSLQQIVQISGLGQQSTRTYTNVNTYPIAWKRVPITQIVPDQSTTCLPNPVTRMIT